MHGTKMKILLCCVGPEKATRQTILFISIANSSVRIGLHTSEYDAAPHVKRRPQTYRRTTAKYLKTRTDLRVNQLEQS